MDRPITLRRLDRCVAARRAVAAVEFAISLTVLMLFVFVGFEFFRASMLRHNADCAAYEAARRAIVVGASNANAVAMANDYLARVGVAPTSVTVSPNPIDENTTQINVEVRIAMNNNSWVVPSFMNGKVIVGRSRLMTERAPINLVGALPLPPAPPAPPAPPPQAPPPPSPPPIPML